METFRDSVVFDPKKVGDVELRDRMCRECTLKAEPCWEARMVERLAYMDPQTLPLDAPYWLVSALSFLRARRSPW